MPIRINRWLLAAAACFVSGVAVGQQYVEVEVVPATGYLPEPLHHPLYDDGFVTFQFWGSCSPDPSALKKFWQPMPRRRVTRDFSKHFDGMAVMTRGFFHTVESGAEIDHTKAPQTSLPVAPATLLVSGPRLCEACELFVPFSTSDDLGLD